MLIRKAEALAHCLRWTAADSLLGNARAALANAESQVAERTQAAARAASVRADAASALEPLRQVEAQKGAALHRLGQSLSLGRGPSMVCTRVPAPKHSNEADQLGVSMISVNVGFVDDSDLNA